MPVELFEMIGMVLIIPLGTLFAVALYALEDKYRKWRNDLGSGSKKFLTRN